jgi:cobyrinic acid a,c-diamide synthase
VIAGAGSGVGKTSVSLALVAAFRRRGLRVQPFKVGPDFLDPTYLARAAGRTCYNLDGWMTSERYVRELFVRASADADVAVIEGVMGLFDGADPIGLEASTAEIALWLDAPVLLVVNAHGVARSLAAQVKGYAEFEPRLKLAGVIANRSGSEGHGKSLAESLAAAGLPPLLGAIPRGAFPELPSRHLGLVTADGENISTNVMDELADALATHASIDAVLDLAHAAPPLTIPARAPVEVEPKNAKTVRIGVAFDRAFHFYYPDNLEALESAGAELVHFSPIGDERLPDGLDGLYLGGGYPEESVAALSANEGMLDSIRSFAGAGRPIYAECGGLMYLSEGLETLDGKCYPLVGLLPTRARMLDRLKSLGYVEVTLKKDSIWGASGTRWRGHEFHYSDLTSDMAGDGGWNCIYDVERRRTGAIAAEGFAGGSVLASYVHAHFASRPELAANMVKYCGEDHDK